METRRRKVSSGDPPSGGSNQEQADRDQAIDGMKRGFVEPKDFRAREGDTLVVNFGGASLQIAAYSQVQIDSAIYTRKLEAGEDAEMAFAEVYAFLRKECLDRARQKLADFAEEHAKAKKRASGE